MDKNVRVQQIDYDLPAIMDVQRGKRGTSPPPPWNTNFIYLLQILLMLIEVIFCDSATPLVEPI